MKWSCHMVGAPILKYKRPRNTFSTARDTISFVSMKAKLFIRHYINATKGVVSRPHIHMPGKQQQCINAHTKYHGFVQ